MNYTIKPDENEFRAARNAVQNEIENYEDGLELETFEIFLNWQSFGRPVSFQTTENELILTLNSDYGWEGKLARQIVRGLLELEFQDKMEYDEIEFHWQEIAKMSYVKAREKDFLEEETVGSELTADKSEIVGELSGNNQVFSEVLYENAGPISQLIGDRIRGTENLEDLPRMSRSDIEELIREVV